MRRITSSIVALLVLSALATLSCADDAEEAKPSFGGSGGGGVVRHAAIAIRQRSVNGQPGGRSASSGTVPAIVCRRVPGAAPSFGRAANRPCVYGCAMRPKTCPVLFVGVLLIVDDVNGLGQAEASEVLDEHEEAHEAWQVQGCINVVWQPVVPFGACDLSDLRHAAEHRSCER